MKIIYLFFVAVILLFLSTRLYKISEIPPSLYWDEASIGYNAYSIATTGRDEWGDFLPLHFRAFGEFKLPVYIYSVAILGKIIGFNELTVRIPAVLFSLGVIIITFLLVNKLTTNKILAILSSFFLTISPWFFIISRTGFEATAGLMFFLLGIYLFAFVRQKQIFIFSSTISFIASIYSYNSFRLITPIVLICLFAYLLLKNFNKTNMLVVIISGVIFISSLIPIGRLIFLDNGAIRFQTIGLNQTGNNFISEFTKNYFSHFSPDFLFINGDVNLRTNLGQVGELYWLQLPLILLGLIYLLSKRNYLSLLTIFILLIAPIPAAITKEAPHALRSFAMIPFFSIMSAMGVVFIYEKIKYIKILTMGIIIIFGYFYGIYLNNFNFNYPSKSSAQWQYGYQQIFKNYQNQFASYDQILISDVDAQPYIFALYYLLYDPKRFLAEVQYNPVDKWGFSKVASFNNFLFKPVIFNNLPMGKTLIFAGVSEKLENIEEQTRILNLDNSVAFYVYEFQK